MNRLGMAPERFSRGGQKVWLINAPYRGNLIFKGEPTSLLYASAPLMHAIYAGELGEVTPDEVALLNPSTSIERCMGEFQEVLARQNLRFVAISTTTAGCIEARLIARTIKQRFPHAIIVFGGPHEDDLPDEQKTAVMPDYARFVDFSVAGDGEFALLELARAALEYPTLSAEELKQKILEHRSRFEKMKGMGALFFSLGNETVCLRYYSPLDLDSLPLMPRELLHEKDARSFTVFSHRADSVKTAQIMTERGCPWNCTFCSESTKASRGETATLHAQTRKGVNRRSVQHVIEEVEQVLSFRLYAKDKFRLERDDYRAIFFDDSTFTHAFGCRRDYLNELLGELQRLRSKHEYLEWGCQTRIDQLDEGVLEMLLESGCTYIYIGLESVNDRLLKQMAKGMSKEQICEGFALIDRLSKKHGGRLRLGVSLVFGIPDLRTGNTMESPETVRETVDFLSPLVEKGLVSIVSPNIAVYYPGTLMSKFSKTPLDFHYSSGEVPYPGYPWNRFEEGTGYHAKNLSVELAEHILNQCIHKLGEAVVNQDLYNVEEVRALYWDRRLPKPYAYLNHVSISRPSEQVAKFVNELQDADESKRSDILRQTRQRVADLLQAPDARQIAFARNTSEACSIALWLAEQHLGRPIETVMITDIENFSIRRAVLMFADHANVNGRYRWSSYPTFGRRVYKEPYIQPRERGTRLSTVPILAEIVSQTNNVEERIIEAVQRVNPDFLVLSHVDRNTGRIIDVAKVLSAVKQSNPSLYVVVDGAKAVGAIEQINVPLLGADFYAFAPHYTIGSYPVGILWHSNRVSEAVRTANPPAPECLHILRGMFHEEAGIRCNLDEEICIQDVGSVLKTIQEMEEKGLLREKGDFTPLIAVRRERKQMFQDLLANQVPEARLVSPVAPRFSDYVMAFQLVGWDAHALVEQLWTDKHVMVSYIARPDLVRVSFNHDNTEEEIRYAVNSLKELMADRRLLVTGRSKQ